MYPIPHQSKFLSSINFNLVKIYDSHMDVYKVILHMDVYNYISILHKYRKLK